MTIRKPSAATSPGRDSVAREATTDDSVARKADKNLAADEQARRHSLALLAGGLAHDVNNHLTGIFGNVDLLLRQLPSDSACRPMVQNIERCAQHAGELMETLRCYAGRGILQPEAVSLTQVIRNMTRLLEASLPSGARLIWHLDDQLPEIQGEAEKIRHLVLQLTLNAVEALEGQGGEVTLACGVEEVSEVSRGDFENGDDMAPGRHVYFEVTDSGRGMDETTRRRLFDPFFTTKGRGQGMGMATVLGVARLHRGGIRVDTALGGGTRVRVLLPVTRHDLPAASPSAAAGSGGAAGKASAEVGAREGAVSTSEMASTAATVLVVDDEDFVRSVAQEILQAEGMATLGAGDGLEALAVFALHRQDIDLVLLDLTMPGLDGGETLKRLRQMEPGVQVVITSGQEPGAAVEAVVGPTPGFLRKPYRPHQLLETLRLFLGNHET